MAASVAILFCDNIAVGLGRHLLRHFVSSPLGNRRIYKNSPSFMKEGELVGEEIENAQAPAFELLDAYYRNFHPFSVKNSPKVLPFEKKYLLLRCILSKVKNNIN